MITASVFAAVAVVLAFTPTEVLVAIGLLESYETELVRWAGGALFLQAILIGYVVRRRVSDASWRRTLAAADAAGILGAAYIVSGNPFFLILGFSTLVAVVTRTMMLVLDHWSGEVRSRWERYF